LKEIKRGFHYLMKSGKKFIKFLNCKFTCEKKDVLRYKNVGIVAIEKAITSKNILLKT